MTNYKFQHSAKFICISNIPGTHQTTDALLPGSYRTSVNIHNPYTTKIELRKKIASPSGISKYFESVLEPDGVERVTCAQIKDFDLQLSQGFEGFLVIESTERLDVVAVYTAGGKEVASIHVQIVPGRELFPC